MKHLNNKNKNKIKFSNNFLQNLITNYKFDY